MDTLCPQDAALDVIPRECQGSIGFTLAFENYILILIPGAILLLLTPIRIRTIWSRSVKVVSPTILQAVKTLSSLCFAGFSLALLVISTQLADPWRRSETAAGVVSFLAALVCLALSHLEHFRSVRPSMLLQLYLMVAVIVEAVHLRTVWIRSTNVTMKTVCCGQLASCAIFLLSESIGKESILLRRTTRSPQDVNDLFSQRLFFWLNDLFVQGYRKVLAPRDLYSIDEDLASPQTQRVFRLTWLSRQQKNPEGYLYWTLFFSMRRYFLFPVIPRLLLLGVNFAQPYLIQRFVAYIDDPVNARPNEGPLLVLAAFCLYTSLATFQSWYWQCCNRYETKLRGTLITAIHEKALRARPAAEYSPLMLMNVDVEKSVSGSRFQHEFWATVLSMALALYLLKGQVGLSFLAPTVLMVILTAIVMSNGSQVAPKQKIWLGTTQTRVSFITGVIASLKNIKLMGLVPMILDMGTHLRQKEVDAQKEIRKAIFLNLMISQVTFQLSAVVLYGAYAIQVTKGGPPLTNSNLFSSMAILKLFTTPLLSTIQWVTPFIQALAAMSRIQAYLKSEEHHDQRIEADQEKLSHAIDSTSATGTSIAVLQDVTSSYAGKLDALTTLNCSLIKSKLHLVIGAVGSGKSTLLKTVIGETVVESGSVMLSTFDTSFCDQHPFLWNGSIKQNIVGEEELNDGWFDQVSWACGLDEDYRQLPHGAETKCGDEGTALSGGQKNRISLARAVYSRKQFFVSDDVLSGLDTRTEALVFSRVFGPSGLLQKAGTTTLLATHSVGWLKYADQVLILDNGACAYQGSPSNIPSTFSSLITHSAAIKEEVFDATANKDGATTSTTAAQEAEDEPATVPRDRRIYLDYLRSFGMRSLLLYFPSIIIFHAAKSMSLIWLKWWAGANTTSSSELAMYASVFAVVILATIAAMVAELWYALMHMMPRSSLALHAMQWAALVQVRFSAWSGATADSGGAANRFSQDIMLVDMQLPNAFLNVASIAFELVANLAIILVASPFIAAALPIVGGVLWVIQDIYLRTSKQLRVMDLEAKAPLCRHFLETVGGVVTINAFGWGDRNRERNVDLLEKSQAPFYLLLSIQQWLQLVLDLVVAGLATVLMSVCVALAERLDAGYLGLALLSVMDLGNFLNVFVVAWTMFDTSLGAVARIKDFCNRMPREEQGREEVGADWMACPKIEVKDLTASYAEGAEPILKGVNLIIEPGQKVAVCGRTGSGKSSLASALFGLLSIQTGSIEIDGFNISQVSQDALRSKMVALPQDAYFAPGTVRDNLALRHVERELTTDDMMVAALKKVGLSEKFEKLAAASEGQWSGALDVELNPAEMLTKGQGQLFAMARTMLSKGQIVMIDEATSGLDKESDDKLQELLRSEMKGKTIIAIAHRLSTILDFDVVVVMDKGVIVEVGAPEELKMMGGRFAELVRGGGEEVVSD